jgi:diguanylate cyclase (GGDEF)-like protein
MAGAVGFAGRGRLKRVRLNDDEASFVDLDEYKAVNDGLGHAAGDTLLCAVAGRLSECLRPSDTIARLGRDEFAVLLDGVADVAEVMNVGQRLLDVLQLPVEIGGLSVTVPASIGIAIAEQGDAHSNLMRDADIALYRAKQQGENRIAVFDTSMGWEAYSRLRLRTQLESAGAVELGQPDIRRWRICNGSRSTS